MGVVPLVLSQPYAHVAPRGLVGSLWLSKALKG
jgi:hypothetical protein